MIKTDLSSLDALVPSPKPKELTWEDIIAEDPLEGEIWRDVDFGVESSEGEGWSSDDDNESRVAGRSRLWEMDDAKRDKKNLKRRRDEDEEEELWRTKAWEGMARVADEDGLRELKARQYWQQRVKDQDDEAEQTDAEDAEGVDVSLSAGGCKSRLLQPIRSY